MNTFFRYIFLTYSAFSQAHLPACRHIPSCSEYAQESLERYGFAKGGLLLVKRLFSCQPFSKRPFYDPVPQT